MTPPAFVSARPFAHSFQAPGLASAEPSGGDIALLQSHVQRCGQERRRWADVRTTAASIHYFFAPRFATTLTLFLVVIVAVSMAV